MRSRGPWRWIAGIGVAALVFGCGVPEAAPKTMPYAVLVEMLGIRARDASSAAAEGQVVALTVHDAKTDELLRNARVFLDADELRASNGQFEVPLSAELRARNAVLRVVAPEGHDGGITLRFDLALSAQCRSEGQAGGGPAVRLEVDGWQAIDVGRDRIYLQDEPSAARVQQLARLLTHTRAVLADVSAVEPPAFGVAVARDGEAMRHAAPDGDQRMIWPVAASRAYQDRFIGVVAHEWMHRLLDELGFPGDGQLRYIEEGLADLVAHLAEQRLLGRALTPTLQERSRLLEAVTVDQVDMYALALELHPKVTLRAMLDALCQPRTARAYALGLAYWFGRTGGEAQGARAFLADFRRLESKSEENVIRLLAQSRPNARALSVREARHWLSTGNPGRPPP